MLSNITWTQYLIVIGGSVLLYYIIYFIKFHAGNILAKLHENSSDYEEYVPNQEDDNTHPEDEDDHLLQLETLVNSIRSDILVKAGDSATKEELLEAISVKVANYDGLHQPAYRYALNHFIIQQFKNTMRGGDRGRGAGGIVDEAAPLTNNQVNYPYTQVFYQHCCGCVRIIAVCFMLNIFNPTTFPLDTFYFDLF